jgi:hypothetical protein
MDFREIECEVWVGIGWLSVGPVAIFFEKSLNFELHNTILFYQIGNYQVCYEFVFVKTSHSLWPSISDAATQRQAVVLALF